MKFRIIRTSRIESLYTQIATLNAKVDSQTRMISNLERMAEIAKEEKDAYRLMFTNRESLVIWQRERIKQLESVPVEAGVPLTANNTNSI